MALIHCPSPNHDARAVPVSMLVLHYTGMHSGAAALQRLCDPAIKLSAHYVLEEDGSVFALVDEGRRAWHAGLGCWHGISDVNSASIGIEIVNGGHDFGLPEFPEAQMQALTGLCHGILARHTIAPRDIVGHSDIAPTRKIDPGERFSWQRLARAGIGLWPDAAQSTIAETDWHQDFAAIGYCPGEGAAGEAALLRAFQRRYLPDAISGRPCVRTRAAAHALAQMLADP